MKRVGKLPLICAVLLMLPVLAACTPAGGGDTPPEEDGGVTTLVYAQLTKNGVDREAVRQFNMKQKNVQIEIKNYAALSENGRKGADLLLTEIAAGNIPDIIDMGDRHTNYQLPYRKLAQQGYLEDLWPYIENDPDLGRENVVEAPLKAAGVNGGLYLAFDSFYIQTLTGSTSMVGDRTSWTFADLQEAFAAMPEGAAIFDLSMSNEDILYYLGRGLVDDFVDWETGKCSFDSDKFRAILSFAYSFPPDNTDYSSWTTEDNIIYNEEMLQRQAAGLQMLHNDNIMDAGSLLTDKALYSIRPETDRQISYVGYPVEDGSVGSYFIPSKRKVAISSTCKDKDAAWELIRQMFLPKPSDSTAYSSDEIQIIPINMGDYMKMANTAKTQMQKGVQIYYHTGPLVDKLPLTEEEYQRFEDFMNSITRIDIWGNQIFDIVQEQCGPYFAGDKTLDETVDLIQRRVSLYVSEQM